MSAISPKILHRYVKILDRRIDELREALAHHQKHLKRLELEASQIDKEIVAEQSWLMDQDTNRSHVHGHTHTGGSQFIHRMVKDLQLKHQEISHCEREVSFFSEQIADVFIEKKKYETLLDLIEAEARHKEQRDAQRILDEVGSMAHLWQWPGRDLTPVST